MDLPVQADSKKPESVSEEKNANSQVVPAEKKEKSEPEAQAAKKSKEDRSKKRDDMSVEQVLRMLSSLGTSEEKLAAMCKKYSDIVDENRKLMVSVKQVEKKALSLQREKEQLQTEHSKTVLTRSRLEGLCRELQKQNKQIKEESLQKAMEEEEKRKAVSAKFQTTLSEITLLMQQNNENNAKLRDENLEMQNRFKAVCEQYEMREQQVEKMSKQMQLESHLAEAKLAKLKIEMAAEKELLENDKKQLLIELAAYQQKCQELQKTEATLNGQISTYNEKYDKFQDALAKSNQLYCGFKGEIKNMSKKIAKLEKETSIWKMRWENNHKSLLQVGAEKQQLMRQLTQLQKLCRTLQADRTALLAQLKSEGITPKLPGDINSTVPTSQESESKSETSEMLPTTELEVVENGMQGVSIADKEISLPIKEEIESEKEIKEQRVPVPDVNASGDKANEVVSKSNSNSKAKGKGGKESSEKR